MNTKTMRKTTFRFIIRLLIINHDAHNKIFAALEKSSRAGISYYDDRFQKKCSFHEILIEGKTSTCSIFQFPGIGRLIASDLMESLFILVCLNIPRQKKGAP